MKSAQGEIVARMMDATAVCRKASRRRKIATATAAVAAVIACGCSLPLFVTWRSNPGRRGQDLTPVQAQTVAEDPAADRADRRRAIHRLSKAARAHVRALIEAARQDLTLRGDVDVVLQGLRKATQMR